MSWYDLFSHVYDTSVARHYREQREAAVEALQLEPGGSVLDCPVGTGLSAPGLKAGIVTGRLVGADLSPGMLAKAATSPDPIGWNGTTTFVHADASTLSAADIGGPVDRLHVFLGMSAFCDMEGTFDNLWALLKPGGRFVVVDVHTERLGVLGRMVNLTARADIRRRFWEPIESRADDYRRVALPSKPVHGGQLWLVSGSKAT